MEAERLCEQMLAIRGLVNDKNLKQKIQDLCPNLLNFEDKMFAEKLIAIVQPFKKALELLSVENTPTLSVHCLEYTPIPDFHPIPQTG